MRVSSLVIAVFAVSAWLPAPALAQTKAAKTKAKQHYKRALAYEDLKDWDNAIAEYEKAQALLPDAEFHFLIAEVQEKRGDNSAALERYRNYVAAEPRGRVAKKARAAIKRLEPIVAAEERERKAKLEAERKKAEAEREKAEAEHEKAEHKAPEQTESGAGDGDDPAAADVVVDSPPSDDGGKSGGTLKIAGLATAGIGVVAIGVGVYFGLDARSAESDVEEKFDPARFDEGESANRNMKIMLGVGIVAVAGGAALYVLGSRSGSAEDSRGVAISPSVDSDGFGVVVRGGF